MSSGAARNVALVLLLTASLAIAAPTTEPIPPQDHWLQRELAGAKAEILTSNEPILTQSQVVAAVRMDDSADRAGLDGTVIMGSGDNAYTVLGLYDRSLPYRDKVWRWASVTKQVVAVLIMQEVEKGRIALDAPATRYLPNVALPGGDAVTVRRLLNHSSGLYNPDDGRAGPDGTPVTYLRSGTPAPKGLDPQCLMPSGRAPGAQFVYNNCDYVVLGALLEHVAGKPFAVLVSERIATPLGLNSLRVLQPGDRDDIVAVDDKGGTDDQVDPGRYGAAANLAGTAEDLLTFDRALMEGTLLGKAATQEMWKGDPNAGYAALGQWSYPVDLKGCSAVQHVVERRGQVGNVQVRNLIAPERGIAIVAFAASSVPDFGEPWQGKGLTYDLLRAALCTEDAK